MRKGREHDDVNKSNKDNKRKQLKTEYRKIKINRIKYIKKEYKAIE